MITLYLQAYQMSQPLLQCQSHMLPGELTPHVMTGELEGGILHQHPRGFGMVDCV